MRVIVLAIALILAMCPAGWAQKVGGEYTVKGTNPNGSTYSGTAMITPRGDGCRITWDVGTQWHGLCLLNGDAFAATYSSSGTSGLLIYRLQPDGTLSGFWVLDSGGTGTEALIPR